MHDEHQPLTELEKVAHEISALREQMAAVSAAMNRIEKRLKLIFPAYKKSEKQRAPSKGDLSTKTRDDLLSIFEDLIVCARNGGDVELGAKLNAMSGVDLVALAYELGVGDNKKMGLNKAKEGVKRRVHESLLLSNPATNAHDGADNAIDSTHPKES